MRLETAAVHAGRTVGPPDWAISPHIVLSTTFERGEDGGYPGGHQYSRGSNPNRLALEECLRQLEGGDEAFCFGSGMAAIQAIFQTLKPGDHVVMPDQFYWALRGLADDVLSRWQIGFSWVDMQDLSAVERAIQPTTRIIWTETPSNPQLKITDLEAVSNIALKHGLLSVCDNTWPTPLLQQPIELGCDVVMHSTTKYLGGHSDVLGGALVVKDNVNFRTSLRQVQSLCGGVPSPFECWLTLRGIESLPARMRVCCENTRLLASWLSNQPAVAKIHFPGLPSHPHFDTAARQMRDFGGMLSFEMETEAKARHVANACKLIKQATSLGGTHTLIEHRASVEGTKSTTPNTLLRLSVGQEHPADLMEDLHQAILSA